jgi:hypothetical protein
MLKVPVCKLRFAVHANNQTSNEVYVDWLNVFQGVRPFPSYADHNRVLESRMFPRSSSPADAEEERDLHLHLRNA